MIALPNQLALMRDIFTLLNLKRLFYVSRLSAAPTVFISLLNSTGFRLRPGHCFRNIRVYLNRIPSYLELYIVIPMRYLLTSSSAAPVISISKPLLRANNRAINHLDLYRCVCTTLKYKLLNIRKLNNLTSVLANSYILNLIEPI